MPNLKSRIDLLAKIANNTGNKLTILFPEANRSNDDIIAEHINNGGAPFIMWPLPKTILDA